MRDDAKDAALAFLQWWFEYVEEGFVQLTYIRDGRVRTSSYPIAQGFERAVDEAVRRNAAGENCYFRTAPLGRLPAKPSDRGGEELVGSSPGMWAEVDVAEAGGHKQKGAIAATFDAARNWIEALPIEPSVVIHSGGGYHLYWRANEPRSFELGDWAEGKRDATYFEAALQKRSRECGFGLDTNITRNFACLLRVPGLVNWKRAAGHVVTIEQFRESLEYSWSDFEEVAAAVLGAEDATAYLYSERAPLPAPGEARAPKGRNDTLKSMAAACLAQGKKIGEVVGELVAYDLQAHDPPLFLDRSEGMRTGDAYTNALGFVSSIMQSIQVQAEASGRSPDYGNLQQLRTLTTAAGALTEDPFERIPLVSFANAWMDRSGYEPHLLESVLPKSTLTVIAGPPKSQKSLMLLELAVKLATGKPWQGFKPLRPLRVLLIQFEMPLDMMRRRIHGMGGPGGYSSATLEQLDRNFIYSAKAVAPFDRDSFPHYVNFARRGFPDLGAPPDVIVFDPLQNMYTGDENSNADMAVFLRLLDEFRDTLNPEAATIILHHANKTNRKEMLEDPFNALRGASYLRGYYTSAIFVAKLSEEGEERKIFFDVRAGIAPAPKVVEYQDGAFVDVMNFDALAGETQLDTWNAERRRQRDRILREINRRALCLGEIHASKELSELLAEEDDLPGSRRVRSLLSEYATRGYLRFSDGSAVGFQPCDGRSSGYVITETTEILGDLGVIDPVLPTHYKDRTNGLLVKIDEDSEPPEWHYDDPEFTLELINPQSNVEPFRGRR